MMKPSVPQQLNYVNVEELSKRQGAKYLSRAPEEANTSEISEHDVLCGRGGLTNSHIGNKHYRQIVADHQEEYLKARKRDKIIIAQRIVSIVKDNGGRFLKKSSDGESWVPITDKKAQEKTSQALREGLDVRNHKIRPSKQIRRDDDSINSGERRRKYIAIAQGKVVSSSPETLPTLSEEPPAPLFMPYERQISQSEICDACEI